MTKREKLREELIRLDRSSWPGYLDEHSGLPGPRANIELAIAAAGLVDQPQLDRLLDFGNEFQAMCGAIALAERATDQDALRRARELAADARWRVREGVAIGLQLLADTELQAMQEIVLDWVDDTDPLVQRAAAAAICEPRLLKTPAAAAIAVEVCRRATVHLEALPRQLRRMAAARTLRQGLGYCWSVAIAADPGPVLATFRELDDADPDVAWIIAQNRTKKRLSQLL